MACLAIGGRAEVCRNVFEPFSLGNLGKIQIPPVRLGLASERRLQVLMSLGSSKFSHTPNVSVSAIRNDRRRTSPSPLHRTLTKMRACSGTTRISEVRQKKPRRPAREEASSEPCGSDEASTDIIRPVQLRKIEAISIHDLGPCSSEVIDKLRASIARCVDIRDGSQDRVRTEHEVITSTGPLEGTRNAIATLEDIFGTRCC